MTEVKKYIEELDYLRGFAIIAVILIHTSANFVSIENLNFLVVANVIIDVFSHFAVPVFVILSGLALSNNYFEKINYVEYYTKRFRSIVPQYIFFSLFYIFFYYIISGRAVTPLKFIYWILTANASVHLWFFLLIIQLYLIYPYIIKTYLVFSNRNKVKSLILYSILVQFIFNILILYITSIIGNSTPGIIIKDLIDQSFISYISYFIIGIFIGRNIEYIRHITLKINYKVLTLLLIYSTMFISIIWMEGIRIYGNFDNIPKIFFISSIFIGPLQYLVVFIILWKVTVKLIESKDLIAKIIKHLGNLSFGIYLIHFSFIVILSKFLLLFDIGYSDWIFYPFVFLVTTFLSVIFCKVISHNRYIYHIIGYKERPVSSDCEL